MKKILETERLLLREFEQTDLDALKKFMPIPGDEYAHRWLDWCIDSYSKNGFGHWAALYKETGEVIGSIGISMQLIDNIWRPEIGYHLRKDYHKQGLGTEAAIAVRDYFFTHFDDNEVFTYMDEDNRPSYRVAENNGMTFIKFFISKEGKKERMYRITRQEWEKLK